jgi:hypothetical protein
MRANLSTSLIVAITAVSMVIIMILAGVAWREIADRRKRSTPQFTGTETTDPAPREPPSYDSMFGGMPRFNHMTAPPRYEAVLYANEREESTPAEVHGPDTDHGR